MRVFFFFFFFFFFLRKHQDHAATLCLSLALALLRRDRCERTGAGLSRPADPHPGAVPGRRRRRHDGAHRGNKLSERIGQPVLVEHRPGAGGTLGADAVAKAAPDGYTVLLTSTPSRSALRSTSLPFDPLKAFEPIVQVAANPFVLVGSQKMQAATIQEVIALAKAKPGTLNYGSSGLGAPLHLLAEMFKYGAGGLDIAHIPYRGDAPMLTALLSGDVQIGFMPASTGTQQVKNGQVRGARQSPDKSARRRCPRQSDATGSRRQRSGSRIPGTACSHRRGRRGDIVLTPATRNGRWC